MSARKWSDEQKARQAALIHAWKPWATSTGPKTPEGKAASKKNAVNYSLRAVTRELARTNRALLAYLTGAVSIAPSIDQASMDKLLDDVERAVKAPRTPPTTKAKAKTASKAKRPASEPRQQGLIGPPLITTEQGLSFFDQIPSSFR